MQKSITITKKDFRTVWKHGLTKKQKTEMVGISVYKTRRSLANIQPRNESDGSYINKEAIEAVEKMFTYEEWDRLVKYAYEVKEEKEILKVENTPEAYKSKLVAVISRLRKKSNNIAMLEKELFVEEVYEMVKENNKMLKELLGILKNEI